MTISVTPGRLYKVVVVVLLSAILGLVLWSQPWNTSSSTADKRQITVTGSATIDAVPDEFTFTPYYQETGSDKEALQADLLEKANGVVDKLKELGVPEEKISLDASSYDRWYWQEDEEGVLSVSITVKIADEELVQAVQDYLLTTGAEGQITPRASFSDAKQKELDAQAVEQASADAKQKAEAQAAQFDAKLGSVISVQQGRDSIFEGYSTIGINELSLDSSASSRTLPVLPGEEEYQQTVHVVYELK